MSSRSDLPPSRPPESISMSESGAGSRGISRVERAESRESRGDVRDVGSFLYTSLPRRKARAKEKKKPGVSSFEREIEIEI